MSFNLANGAGFFRGRVALAAILRAFGLRPGDAVAVQAFTCSALAEALLHGELKPQWIDIDPATFTIDPRDLERKIDGTTRAIIVQHTYGIPADMDAVAEIARRHGVPVIEDCCHTLSSRWHGATVGSLGDAAFYSFESGKPLVAGLGGWGLVNREEFKEAFASAAASMIEPPLVQQIKIRMMYEAFRLLYTPRRFWAMKRMYRRLRDAGILASNYNADDADAPLFDAEEFTWRLGGLQQRVLRRIAGAATDGDAARKRIAELYSSGFAGGAISGPTWDERADPVLIRFPVRVPDKERMLGELEKASIEASDNYSTPIHPYTGEMLRKAGYEAGSCPEAEKAGREVVALSCAPAQSDDAIAETIRTVKSIAA